MSSYLVTLYSSEQENIEERLEYEEITGMLDVNAAAGNAIFITSDDERIIIDECSYIFVGDTTIEIDNYIGKWIFDIDRKEG